MNLDRLTELLDAYGADPQHWPRAERAAAGALLERSAPARARLLEAQSLDLALDSFVVAPPTAGLRAHVQGSFRPQRTRWQAAVRELWRDLGGWQLAGPAFAASLALGALLPYWLDDYGADLPSEDLIAAMQLVDEFPEVGP